MRGSSSSPPCGRGGPAAAAACSRTSPACSPETRRLSVKENSGFQNKYFKEILLISVNKYLRLAGEAGEAGEAWEHVPGEEGRLGLQAGHRGAQAEVEEVKLTGREHVTNPENKYFS